MKTELTIEELEALADIVLERFHAALADNQPIDEGDDEK